MAFKNLSSFYTLKRIHSNIGTDLWQLFICDFLQNTNLWTRYMSPCDRNSWLNFLKNHSFVLCNTEKYQTERNKIKVMLISELVLEIIIHLIFVIPASVRMEEIKFQWQRYVTELSKQSFIFIWNIYKCKNGRNNICVTEISDWTLKIIIHLFCVI